MSERSIGQVLRSYFFWTYERGSFHYDVMVTLILIFMFASPFVIDFKDRPVETVALHSSEVLVKEAGMSGDSSRFIIRFGRKIWAGRRRIRSGRRRYCGS